MDIRRLEEKLKKLGQPQFRLEQIRKAVFQDGIFSFLEITTLSKDLREKLLDFQILSFEPAKVLMAQDKRSIKALLKLDDGRLIETVLISPKPGTWSACVSCQVGCPMNCRFCATGKMGLERNLTAEEITDQVLFWRQYLKKNKIAGSFSNIIYMGMGEPFANWDNVAESLRDLTDQKIFGFGSRNISVSTSGLPDGIQKFSAEFPQINLAISLHFADDEKRSKYMPVNKSFDLAKLRDSLRDYFKKTNRKVFIEYILLEGINDGREDAMKLSAYLKSIGKLQLLHVNLIRYNTTGEELNPSSRNKAQEFKNYLLKNHIQVTIRKSLGEEIQGACGQLAGK